MNWYKIEFTKDDLAKLRHIELDNLVRDSGVRHGLPPGFVLFALFKDDRPSGTYCLPPSAKDYCPEILKAYHADECDQRILGNGRKIGKPRPS